MRKFLSAIIAALALIAAADHAAWPQSRTIRVILPVPPGGAIDILSRILAEEISKNAGVTMIVESKPGAGSIIAAEYVAHAAPDGNTLLSNNNSIIVSSILHKVNYDHSQASSQFAIWSRRRRSSSSTARRPITRWRSFSTRRARGRGSCRSPVSDRTPPSTSASNG